MAPARSKRSLDTEEIIDIRQASSSLRPEQSVSGNADADVDLALS
jgi:hypothetical protein